MSKKINFSSIKKFFQTHVSFFLPIVIFLFSIFMVAPWGNYPVNDDWQFFTHVRYFLSGNFVKNPLIDASFILQGFIGLLWAKIFGLSFVSLRILTIIFTIIFFLGFYKILKLLQINSKLILLAFLCLLLEPFILTSSLSFMTEIYFLTFMIWSLYFYLKFLDSTKKSILNINFLLAILLGSLSILIRQFGVVIFIGYLMTLMYLFRFSKKSLYFLSLTILTFAISILINLYFPQYSGLYGSKEDKMLNLFVDLNDIGSKVIFFPKYLVYLTFFLAPLLVSFISKKNLTKIFLLSLPLSWVIFSIDIFDLKNVFHIECYYCESYFAHEYSLVDNVPFKLGLSYLLALLFIGTIFKAYEGKIFALIKVEGKNFALSILSLGMLLIILVVNSFYDRYFLNFAVLVIILIFYNLKDFKIQSKLPYLIFSLFFLIILFLNIDFYNSHHYKWVQAMDIYEKTGKRLKSQIFATGTFARFMNASEKSPEFLITPVKWGVQKCFVLRHIQKQDNTLINFFDSKIFNNRYIKNPTFSNQNSVMEIPRASENLEKTIQVNEYFSPLYNLIGHKTYIISFCTEEVSSRYKIQTQNSSFLK